MVMALYGVHKETIIDAWLLLDIQSKIKVLIIFVLSLHSSVLQIKKQQHYFRGYLESF